MSPRCSVYAFLHCLYLICVCYTCDCCLHAATNSHYAATMTQSINTTAKAACLQAASAFQLPAARARPGPGEGIPGRPPPSGPPGLLTVLSNPGSGSQVPRGGLARGCAWGALGQGHTEGTPKAHIQHRGFGSDPHALRMRGGRGPGMPRTRCSTPIRILRTSEGAPGVCAAGAPKRGAGGAAGDAGVVGGKSTRAHTPGRATAHARGPAPAHTFGFDQPHWARTSRLGRPVLIG